MDSLMRFLELNGGELFYVSWEFQVNVFNKYKIKFMNIQRQA